MNSEREREVIVRDAYNRVLQHELIGGHRSGDPAGAVASGQ